jgi:hypothetical protein
VETWTSPPPHIHHLTRDLVAFLEAIAPPPAEIE